MFNSKYSNVLTIILIIIIILIFGLLAFLGYDVYRKYFITKDTSNFLEEYEAGLNNKIKENTVKNEITTENQVNNSEELVNLTADTNQVVTPSTDPSTSGGTGVTYKGYEVVGKIEIPKTNIKYPILGKVTKKSIEVAVALLYGPGINEPGNSVIIGHNYRNGLFFSNNKKLVKGDKIYITDNSGKTLTYLVYDMFQTTESDTSFYQRDTGGVAEISLQTCTDDSKMRLIVLAKAE